MSTGSIEIHFIGIAVHLNNVPPVAGIPPNVLHRVVTISNSADLKLGGRAVAPIVPHQLQVPAVPNIPWKATFSIANASDGPVTYSDCYRCVVYSLKEVTQNPDLQLNPGLVTGDEVPDQCSVRFFDVTQGEFDAYQLPSGAGVAVLTVMTSGDPQMTILDRSSGTSQTVTFPSPAVLGIHNHGDITNEADGDFLLSYLATNEMSDHIPALKSCPGCRRTSFAKDLGPGCSNSNYP